MPEDVRACGLIIAIESYPTAQDMAQALPGTNQAALLFYDWLGARRGVPPQNVYFCADGVDPKRLSPKTHTFGTTRANLWEAVERLVTDRAGATNDLFVLVTGHGLAWPETPGRLPPDYFVASDYVRRGNSGATLVGLGELRDTVRIALGGRQHFYFVDACRNLVPRGSIHPVDSGVVLPPATAGDAEAVFCLFSTSPGASAATGQQFGKALDEALAGRGRAKAALPPGDDWWVTFTGLADYVRSRLTGQQPQPLIEQPPGRVLQLVPRPLTSLAVEVLDARPTDQFALRLGQNHSGLELAAPDVPFTGPRFTHQVPPGDYLVSVLQDQRPLPPAAGEPPQPVNLYEAATVRFTRPAETRGFGLVQPLVGVDFGAPGVDDPGPSPQPAKGTVVFDGQVELQFTIWSRADGGVAFEDSCQKFALDLPVGGYRFEAAQHGTPVVARDFDVKPGQAVTLTLDLGYTATHESVLQLVNQAGRATPVLSESLGQLAQHDLAFWLLVIGASRAVRAHDLPATLSGVPLPWFDQLPPTAQVVLPLVALPDAAPGRLRVVGGGVACEVDAVPGLYNTYAFPWAAGAGPTELSFTSAMRTWTIPTAALPGCVTVVVVVEQGGETRVHQVFVPSRARLADAPALLRPDTAASGSMAFLWSHYAAQTAFAARRDWSPLAGEVVNGPWQDPMLLVLAGYEALRRRDGPLLQQVTARLAPWAGVLPDAQALQQLRGGGTERWAGPGLPLVREALLRLKLDPPARSLTQSSMWTMWEAEALASP